jgi:hypothetical protein
MMNMNMCVQALRACTQMMMYNMHQVKIFAGSIAKTTVSAQHHRIVALSQFISSEKHWDAYKVAATLHSSFKPSLYSCARSAKWTE